MHQDRYLQSRPTDVTCASAIKTEINLPLLLPYVQVHARILSAHRRYISQHTSSYENSEAEGGAGGARAAKPKRTDQQSEKPSGSKWQKHAPSASAVEAILWSTSQQRKRQVDQFSLHRDSLQLFSLAWLLQDGFPHVETDQQTQTWSVGTRG